MMIKKKPAHWPYVPKSQQVESFKSVAQHIEHLFILRNAVNRVRKAGWIGSSHQCLRHKLIREEEKRRDEQE